MGLGKLSLRVILGPHEGWHHGLASYSHLRPELHHYFLRVALENLYLVLQAPLVHLGQLDPRVKVGQTEEATSWA